MGQGQKLSPKEEQEIIRLNEEGYVYYEISDILAINKNTVWKYVSRHNTRIFQKFQEDHDNERGRQIKLLLQNFRNCMDSYRKSRENISEITVVKKRDRAGESVILTQQKVKGQTGNTQHITDALKCLTDIRKIMMMKEIKEDREALAGSSEVTSALQQLEQIARDEMKMAKEKDNS